MTKYIIFSVLIGVMAFSGTALAAKYNSATLPQAELFGFITGKKDDTPIYKIKDGANTCYIAENPKGLLAMSCVK